MGTHKKPTARGILRMIKSAGSFPQRQRAARFEHSIAQWFSRVLMVPLFTVDEIPTVDQYVKWNGSISGWCSSNAGQDITCMCNDFDIVVDCTRSTGNTQWRMEFGSSVDHYQKHIESKNINAKETFLLLVCESVSERTYRSIRGAMRSSDEKFLAVDTELMAHILRISELSVTMNRSDFKLLLLTLFHELHQYCLFPFF